MQILIAVIAAVICVQAIVWIKIHRHSLIASLRTLLKRFARHVMSFSGAIFLTLIVIISCYSNISDLLKVLLPADSVDGIKDLIHISFGVDSALALLQMLALYSIMASFVSCLVLSVGVIIFVVYTIFLKTTRSTLLAEGQHFEEFAPHATPAFKLYLKYNS